MALRPITAIVNSPDLGTLLLLEYYQREILPEKGYSAKFVRKVLSKIFLAYPQLLISKLPTRYFMTL